VARNQPINERNGTCPDDGCQDSAEEKPEVAGTTQRNKRDDNQTKHEALEGFLGSYYDYDRANEEANDGDEQQFWQAEFSTLLFAPLGGAASLKLFTGFVKLEHLCISLGPAHIRAHFPVPETNYQSLTLSQRYRRCP
jgi:hypothetical protein